MRTVLTAAGRILLPISLLWNGIACGGSQDVPPPPRPALAAPTAAQPAKPAPKKEPFKEVHDYLEGLVKEKKIAGVVALVSQNGEVKYTESLGLQDVEAGTPMTPETIFRICSMTKPITSVAVMMLVEEGKIALSDPLSKFVPEFKKVSVAVPDPAKKGEYKRAKPRREITIEDLLTHRSGLTYGFLAEPYFLKLYRHAGISDGLIETKGTITQGVQRIALAPLTFEPGSSWGYSLATDVLGRVIEVASGKSLPEFFYERLLKPLKMNDTHFRLPAENQDRLAAVYQPKEDQTIERLPAGKNERGGAIYSASYPLDWNGKYYSGGAGLVSTVKDYARFAQALLNGGELEGVRVLKKETVDLMTQNRIADVKRPEDLHGDGFGLGFGLVTEARKGGDAGSVGTFSWSGFYNTYFWVDPQTKIVGVVMTQLYPHGHLGLADDFRKKTYAALEP
ncbi:serine hydrolase domain-containing protein [Chondromyces apiculatus]|uniref:Beta-lactamase class C and other penicillin binding protein n=1 Tax=Chondromyces apiculatus DSM 436 TaxID=1192034 RepID=A0A017T5V1_9BACT|nr:serine hydrolase domain-containing protein [Chondromyces apiculatus]EYF04633.1 Beta-lactamase class C and other penicillin binding protein [Chondromyces apiculatus DSM 436]